MCIFRSKKFELYPEETRIHLGYQRQDETSRAWRNRARLEQIIRKEENLYRNAYGIIPECELAERKAAERQNGYQAEPTDEIGAEYRKYWVIDTSPRPCFIAPGIIVEGTDSLEKAKYWRDYHESCG